MRRLVIIAVLSVAAAVGSAQASVDGNWNFTMDSQMGQVSARVTLKAEGNKLTGTFDLGGRTLAVEDGSIDGNILKFVLRRDRPTGGVMVYDMAGKLDGDTIAGTARASMDGQEFELPWSMSRVK